MLQNYIFPTTESHSIPSPISDSNDAITIMVHTRVTRAAFTHDKLTVSAVYHTTSASSSLQTTPLSHTEAVPRSRPVSETDEVSH